MDDIYFEIRFGDALDSSPVAIASTYDAAMTKLTAWTERFWSQLDANGEGGMGICLQLTVTEVAPGNLRLIRATSTVSG